jgi:hypothetical protein
MKSIFVFLLIVSIYQVHALKCYTCVWDSTLPDEEHCKNVVKGTTLSQTCPTTHKKCASFISRENNGTGRWWIWLFYQRCLEFIARGCYPKINKFVHKIVTCDGDLCNTISYEELESKLKGRGLSNFWYFRASGRVYHHAAIWTGMGLIKPFIKWMVAFRGAKWCSNRFVENKECNNFVRLLNNIFDYLQPL